MLDIVNVSPDLESIFYADLFLINNKVWMITGQGKSEAARLATNNIVEWDLARDCVALTRIDDCLYGSYDPGAIHKDNETRKRLHKKYKIDLIAHCLTEPETVVSKHLQSYKPIYETTNYRLGVLLSHYPYPAVMAQQFVDKEQLISLNNVERRLKKFWELTDNVIGTRFLLVSWMPTVEERSELYLFR